MTGDKWSKIDREIGRVADLSRAELVENWRKMFKEPPPKGIKRGLLERARAYRLQVRTFGGLKSTTRRRLLAIAENGNVPKSAPPDRNVESVAADRRRTKLAPR